MDERRMGTGTETRAVAEIGTRTGSGRAEERRNCTRVVDAMLEMGETRVER